MINLPTNDEEIVIIDPEVEVAEMLKIDRKPLYNENGEFINPLEITDITEFAKRCRNA